MARADRLVLAAGRGAVSAGAGARGRDTRACSGRWTRAAVVAVLALLAGYGAWSALHAAPARRVPTAAPGARTAPTPHGWSAVPLAARGAVSRGLGADDQRYFARGSAPGAASLANPAQKLRARFSDGAIAVSAAHGLRVGLSSLAIGRGGSPPLVPRLGSASERQNRVTYSSPVITEWFANGPWGLEQGFTVRHRLAGIGPLAISQALSGNTTVRVNADGRGVTFSSVAGSLRYGDLVVTDATGARVPARISVTAHHLTITIRDAHATYPLRVDPTIQQTAELAAGDGAANDQLGASVAVSGTTIVVGAPGHDSNQGAVYVFSEPAAGWATATQTAELTASDGVAGDGLGSSVAVSGATIVAGAAQHKVGSQSYRGAAYVFTEPAGGWSMASSPMTQTAELSPSDGAAFNEFGDAVAVSGATIAVGSVGHSFSQGALYVFSEPAGGWSTASFPMTQTAELTASDGATNDELGASVAIDGSTIVGGSPNHEVGSNTYQGSAYVFTEPAGGWSTASFPMNQTAELTASDGSANDDLGASVSVSGSTVVAGAPHHTVGSNTDQGAVYVFSEPVGGWSTASFPMNQTAELTVSAGAATDLFGYSVAVSDSTIVAGAAYRSSHQGAAYVFSKPAGGWSAASVPMNQTAALTASDGAAGDQLGASIGISGSTIVAGAFMRSSKRGAAYVFPGPGLATNVSLELSPSSITADGSATSTATATVTDAYGNPVSGDTLTIASDGAQGVSGVVAGIDPGTYVATITSTTTGGMADITATDTSASDISDTQTLTQTKRSTGSVSSPTSTSIVLGGSDGDSVTVSGDAGGSPTGSVDFYECGPTSAGSCASTANQVGTSVAVTAGIGDTATASTSTPFTPSGGPGTYCFYAVYSGDGSYLGSSDGSSDECFTVTAAAAASVSAPTASIIPVGGSDKDSVTVSGIPLAGSPTGSVSFYECGPNVSSCSSTAEQVGASVNLVAAVGNTATATSAGFAPPAGPGTYCFYAVYSGDANYLGSSDGSSDECFTVDPQLHVLVQGSQTYGGTDQSFSAVGYSGFVDGDGPSAVTGSLTGCTTSVGADAPAGTDHLTISDCTGLSAPGYVIEYVDDGFTVTPAPLTITASDGSMTYGGAAPAITAQYSGLTAGDTAPATAPLCLTAASSASPVGNYASTCISAVDPNYAITYKGGTVSVGKAQLTVTASSPQATYGGPTPTVGPSYSGFLNGDSATSLTTQPACAITGGSAPYAAGSYTTHCSGAVAANYTFQYATGTLTVGPAPLTASIIGSQVYGGTGRAYLVASYSGFQNGDTQALMTGQTPTCSTSVPASASAGTYYQTVTGCSGITASNYTLHYADAGFTVRPAPLTITASSPTMTYGDAVPIVTPSYGGFTNGDGPSSLTNDPTCYTPAVPSSPVSGPPPPTLCVGAADPNYTFTYHHGSVTIIPAQLKVTASSQTILYGANVAAVTPGYSGFVNGEGTTSLATLPSCSTSASSASSVAGSPYDTSCSGAVDANYAFSYVDGAVEVDRAPLTITITGVQVYGGSPSFAIAGYAGFVNSESATTSSPVTGAVTGSLGGCATSVTGTSPAAAYHGTISSCGGLSAANYALTYADGGFTVTDATTSSVSALPLASIAVGDEESDSVLVTGNIVGGSPTGTVSFFECGVQTGGSIVPCATGGTPLGIPVTLRAAPNSTATASSIDFTPTDGPGTYCFRAHYSGDNNYNGSTDASTGECFSVTQVGAPATSTPAAASIALGAANTDSVTVAGNFAGGSPTGQVTFFACAPGTTPCSSGGTQVGPAVDLAPALNDTATATSRLFIPSSGPGTYCFRAVYSGDSTYTGSSDGTGRECFTVTKGASSTVEAPTAPVIPAGSSDNAGVTVQGNGAAGPPTGTVSFYVCGPGVASCASTAQAVGGPVTLSVGAGNSSSATSVQFTPAGAGTYCFYAVYAGSSSYLGSSDATGDGCFTVSAPAASQPAATTPPSNSFRIASHSFKNHRIGLTLVLPGPGTLTVTATHAGATLPLGTRTLTVAAAGQLATTLGLSRAASAAVGSATTRHSAYHATVTLTFTPTGGSPRTQTFTLLLAK